MSESVFSTASREAALLRIGADEFEIAFGLAADERLYCRLWLMICREDRHGVIAAQKKKRADYNKRRRAANPSERLRNAMGARLWAALKGRSDGRLFSRLGYSADALKAHLERLFLPDMAWENYGKWHVDHKRPCASFDLTDAAQFAECWSMANLQPLWAPDNQRKGARVGAA